MADSFGLAEAIPLLEQDVVRTIGKRHRGVVHDTAANIQALGIATRVDKLVEDVQQHFHDLFVDTVWPACPRHPAHPLSYRDGAWWCDRDTVPIAALGDLPPGPGFEGG
ncbi:MAG TPA: hypothetical protein VJW73_02960 [Gemmatimonadaceae bacterium]|nr:hypothetical protein [Gemmatimonadaceae bacterium]